MDDVVRPEQRSIQSIEVGFRLIRVMEEAGGKLPLKLLSARAEMPPGKAHNYLVSFMRLGLVVQEPATGHYSLGPYALQLGLAALRQISAVQVAADPLQALQSRFELPTYFSTWGQMGPFIALKHDVELPTPFSLKAGFAFPLLTTATGCVFLAYMPEARTRPLLERERQLHPDLFAQASAIRDEVRAQGFAVSKGHFFRGFSAICAPVFDHEGALAGSVTMLGVATLIQSDPASDMVGAVKEAAATISRGLGCKVP